MPRGSFTRRHTLVLFPGNPTVEVQGSARRQTATRLFQTGSVYHVFPLHRSMKRTLETDGGADQFSFGLVNTSRRSRIAAMLVLSRLFHKRTKHRLRGAIAHSELTDLLGGALIGCKTNHLMKQASRGSLGCRHTAPVSQQPIRAPSPQREALRLPAAQPGC